jgi:hypothetical protein
MLLYIYNDYIFTLLGCNSLLPIETEKRVGKELQAVVQATSDINTKQRRVTINLHNQGRGKHEVNKTWIEMGLCGARDVWAAHKD